jgi:hypothetical protein
MDFNQKKLNLNCKTLQKYAHIPCRRALLFHNVGVPQHCPLVFSKRSWLCRQRLEITQPHQQTCESHQLLVYRIMWLISCLLHQCKSDAIIWHRYTTNKLFQINNRDVITQTFEPLFAQQVNSDEADRNVSFSVIYWVYKCPFCFTMPLALNRYKNQAY